MFESKGEADAAPGPKVEVFLGMGANLGEPLRQLTRAIRGLEAVLEGIVLSSVYRSAPVGYQEQPDFYNLVCRGQTTLPPRGLLEALVEIERALGRVRTLRNAPRLIDLDILFYGDQVIDTPALTIPHPRLHQRAFVLLPLQEIAPEWRHPVLGKTPGELLADAGPLERIERWGPLPARG